ncbi:hypothetical protein DL93DRAFT_2094735 [Clavulina sp. PMI_390]|nr:hypothetical protein DL93DRAFT_2094735 [Clavulina sp. PMI_390]
MVLSISSILRRRRQADDPFAPKTTSWVDDLETILILSIIILLGGGGIAVFIASFVCGFTFWAGLCMVVAVVPLSMLVIIFMEPLSLQQAEREKARLRRREELLRSNEPLRRMPVAASPQVTLPTVPPAAVTAKEGTEQNRGEPEV